MGRNSAEHRRQCHPRLHAPEDTASLPIPDELLTEIFVRLPTPADLVRASAACVSFRRVVADRSFLRQFRKLHAPPLLGFLGPHTGFDPAEPPHPSGPPRLRPAPSPSPPTSPSRSFRPPTPLTTGLSGTSATAGYSSAECPWNRDGGVRPFAPEAAMRTMSQQQPLKRRHSG
ncbi:uncharacterized protein LOC119362389 isoform X2 [Triticum dicoccoides]|uniref:uncharacterized protein LOC119362389 isoform X2 n=1 Tax=Triticum dicoccoides TaxID=85692 RepID=UPI00188E91EE|nr:uncharacterized protein LOC119362389 isoform X2 [Triticum dicoccoides]